MQILDDDVLAPCAGILDLMDNYAFVRTSGYLPGSEDVYVSMSMVRKFGLRRGDAITGRCASPARASARRNTTPWSSSTPSTAPTRGSKDARRLQQADPALPVRAAPPRDDVDQPDRPGHRHRFADRQGPARSDRLAVQGRQDDDHAVDRKLDHHNNPECHLMVVLVDERPEEVTDFERSVKGEVVSSTFDRPAGDHTIVAELAIERAKRLVELGHDVVVLLDGITRLGRAYNLAAPASGRILSGGVDSAALYPPKRFFGAARNIEDGGSLTILATALIESGSKMDEVIFEEFKGTGNMEIRLRRDFADKRIFPAIDAVQSGTRREDLLMSKEDSPSSGSSAGCSPPSTDSRHSAAAREVEEVSEQLRVPDAGPKDPADGRRTGQLKKSVMTAHADWCGYAHAGWR